jgi:hypothetical protein
LSLISLGKSWQQQPLHAVDDFDDATILEEDEEDIREEEEGEDGIVHVRSKKVSRDQV